MRGVWRMGPVPFLASVFGPCPVCRRERSHAVHGDCRRCLTCNNVSFAEPEEGRVMKLLVAAVIGVALAGWWMVHAVREARRRAALRRYVERRLRALGALEPVSALEAAALAGLREGLRREGSTR